MGKMGEADWEIQASSYEINNGNKRYGIASIVNGIIAFNGNIKWWRLHLWGENTMYKVIQLLCRIPEMNVTSCVNYTQIYVYALKMRTLS